MKKLLLLFLLFPFFAYSQQTYFSPGVPPTSTSFTPTFRYIGTDSLVKIFIANGNRSSQVYTAAQANARFGVRGLATGTNYGAFYNTAGKLVLVPGFTTDSGTYFAFDKALYYNAPKTYSTGNPRLVLEGGNKIGLDTTLDAGPVPTNGIQPISPDSTGLGGRLSHYTGIGFRQYGLYLGDDSLSTTYVNIDPGHGTIRLNVQDTASQSANIMYSTGQTLSTSTSVSHRENYLQIDTAEVDLISIDGLEHGYQLRLTQSDSTATFTDDLRHKGIDYSGDYSGQFTDNSLISRKASIMIADSVFTGGIGGALLNGATNTLTAPTVINTGVSTVFEVNGGTGSGNESSLIVAPSAAALNNQVSSTVGYGVSVVTSGPFTGANLGYENPSNSADISNIQVDENNMYIKDAHKKVGLLNNAAMNFVGGEQLMSYRQLDSLKSTWGFSGAVDTMLLARKIGSADMVQHSYTGYGQTIYNPTGQAYTKYINGAGTTLSYGIFGMQSTQENNYSWNFIYDKPNYVGRHQYLDTAFGEFHWALGERYGRLQYTPKGAPNTGVNTLTITNAGSGYTPGTYDLVTANSTRTPATNERYAITVGVGGTVTSCISDAVGAGYQIGDVVTVPTLPGGTGFSTTVVTLATDNWGYFGKQIGVQVDNVTNTVQLGWNGNLTPAANSSLVQIGPRSTIFQQYQLSGPSNGSGLTIGGGNVGSNEAIYLNPYDTGSVFIVGGNGQTQFGSVSAIAANTKYGFFGTQSASGTQGQSARFRTQLIPTANGQVLAQVLVDPPADAVGTGALTATITTAATSLADGTYDNLASTATTGVGVGQTWKVTVLGGNVTAIVPATAATGGTGYAVGNTFTVSTVTGAVFTVASLGYTGLIDIGLEVNAFPLMLPNITAPTTTKFGTVYNTGNILKTVTNNGLRRIMIGDDATGTTSQMPKYDANGYFTPTTVTGSGAPVEATSPTLVTPILGVAAATSINKVAITAPATSATLTIANGATLQQTGAFILNNTLTANSTPTYPTGAGTLLYNPLTTTGDIMYSSSGSTASRLGIGSTNQILTVSGGVPAWVTPTIIIQGSADLTAQTAAGNITTFTVGAATATFNVSAYINVTAVTTDVIQAQVTYTDENNTAQTVSFTTLSTISNSTYNPVTIRAKNGTVITVKTNLTTGVGSITFDAGARIIQN